MCVCVCIAVSDRVVLVRGHADHSRRCDILRLESATVCPASAPVQEPHGPNDIVGHCGHARVVHVLRRLCADIQVRVSSERVATQPRQRHRHRSRGPLAELAANAGKNNDGDGFVHASFHTQARG